MKSELERDFIAIIFAKAPIPGQTKTRLIPAMGAEQAALLHAAMVERAIATAWKSGAAEVELCCTPNENEAFFQNCAEDLSVTLTEQGQGSLGDRMLRAIERALMDDHKVILIGGDCPALTFEQIAHAARALACADVVVMPAEDGGYVLIGATRTHPQMFDDIQWGTSSVLAEQRRNLSACGLTVTETDTLWDVDRPEDLARVKALKPPLEFFWPS